MIFFSFNFKFFHKVWIEYIWSGGRIIILYFASIYFFIIHRSCLFSYFGKTFPRSILIQARGFVMSQQQLKNIEKKKNCNIQRIYSILELPISLFFFTLFLTQNKLVQSNFQVTGRDANNSELSVANIKRKRTNERSLAFTGSEQARTGKFSRPWKKEDGRSSWRKATAKCRHNILVDGCTYI